MHVKESLFLPTLEDLKQYYAVVKSRDIPIRNLLAKCLEIISLVDFYLSFLYCHKIWEICDLLMNINELVLLP